MSASVPVAAIIVFIGAIVFIASTANLMVNIAQSLIELNINMDSHHNRVYTRIEIANATILNNTITLLVKNMGPETIFLVDQGYKWCSLTVSYNSALGWVTYLLDNYNVINITILGSNVAYDGFSREFINPGEGAWITANLPEKAPEIMNGSPIMIVFSSGFGETAKCMVVKND